MSTGHSQHEPGSLWHLFEFGANFSKISTVMLHVLPVLCLPASPLADGTTAASALFFRNAALQVAIFLPLVQLPVLLTGKMGYVDIGWPLGLFSMGLLVLHDVLALGDAASTQGDARDPARPLRAMLTGLVLVLHGGRMLLGALVLFFPYDFKSGDLARYRFAQVRFVELCGMPAKLWPLRMQHDTLQQAAANAVFLGSMACLLAGDFFRAAGPAVAAPSGGGQLAGRPWELARLWPELHALEVAGLVGWLAFWQAESLADGQKLLFLHRARRLRGGGGGEGREGPWPTLGHAPFDGPEFCLWALCRHPNYFCEWMCWNCLLLASLPSLLRLPLGEARLGPAPALGLAAVPVPAWAVRLGILGVLVLTSMFLHNCLNWWTGAAPAEYWSSRGQRAESYKQYQGAVRCFWPFEMPMVDHRRVAGWPCCGEECEKRE